MKHCGHMIDGVPVTVLYDAERLSSCPLCEARKDSARLDWLEQAKQTLSAGWGINLDWMIESVERQKFSTTRQAIDAARAAWEKTDAD